MRTINLLWICLILSLSACQSFDAPKPKAYHRIDLPIKAYRAFEDPSYPYAFEYPLYATIEPIQHKGEQYWINLSFPSLNCKVNISYRALKNNLDTNIADTYNFVSFHQQKAMGILQRDYSYPEERVYGAVFEIQGPSVASTTQFYLTDSLRHFVRGVLYFECEPNNDSLSPVIDFVKADIEHAIRTLRWQ